MDDPMNNPTGSVPKAKAKSSQKLDFTESVRRKCFLQLYVEMGEKLVANESHEKRMQALRSLTDHIKTTEWQYEPVEKYIGQV